MTIVKNTIHLLLCFILFSCGVGNVENVVVSHVPFRVDEAPTEIKCDPPLVRSRRAASLWVELACAWEPEAPWDHIVVKGLGNVRVEATLVSSSGAQFEPAILGSAGGVLEMRFEPEIPNDEMIVLLRLKSSQPLDIRNVSWHNYDPI